MKLRSPDALVLALSLLCGCGAETIEHDGGEESGDVADDEDFPDRLAEAYCSARFLCDPLHACAGYSEVTQYADEEACIASERALLVEVRTAARGAGLTYDPACVDATIARYAAMGCDRYEKLEARDPHVFDVCPPYYGTVPEGENPCFEVVGSDLSDCGRGLVCFEQVCESGASEPYCECEPGFSCDDGIRVYDTCARVVADGQPCDTWSSTPTTICGVESFCNVTQELETKQLSGVCEPRRALGASCDTADAPCSSFNCVDDVCAAPPSWICNDSVAPGHWR